MRVEVYDDPRRFLVESETIVGGIHLVDFTGDRPDCDCEDFTCRRNPRIKEGGDPFLNMCKHQKQVCLHMGYKLLTMKD